MEDNNDTLRGKRLHYDIEEKVSAQFASCHYADAVTDAFKVVEGRLRSATGKNVPAVPLVNLAFNTNNGILNDPNEHSGEIEGRYYLFRGAFQLYRNALAHNFSNIGYEEAFDLVVFANRLLTTLETVYQRFRARQTATPTISFHRSDYSTDLPFFLDVDNDGEDEAVVEVREEPFTSVIKVFDKYAGSTRRIAVEELPRRVLFESIEDMVMGDVDNDGLPELVLVAGWATESGLLIYKYRNGRMELLPKAQEVGGIGPWWFLSARIEDVDQDGLYEITSSIWGTVPADLLPSDYSPVDQDIFGPTGRVSYVHRWDPIAGRFAMLDRRLHHLGGRW